ncbi:MAG: hypothetical protein ACPGWR_16780 [Ardenticatenaceae bacterium]
MVTSFFDEIESLIMPERNWQEVTVQLFPTRPDLTRLTDGATDFRPSGAKELT